MVNKRLVVIGGGAAGFFCAVNAARMNPGLDVCILEKSNKLLSKVRVSGGGRCNVTHACFDISEMITHYPRGGKFLKGGFHQFFTTDTISWFEERGVKLKTEKDGRIFPMSDSSETIINCLVHEAQKYNVKIFMNSCVKSLIQKNYGLELKVSEQIKNDSATKLIQSNFVCVACGGFPKSDQFEWLKSLDHSIVEPVPSLFTFNIPGNDVTTLMGISVESVKIKVRGTKLESEGPVLITHWGLSGPVVLKLSSIGARILATSNWHFTIAVNWLPGFHEDILRDKFKELRYELASQKIINRNPFNLPLRLWEYLLRHSGVPENLRWADLPVREQNRLIQNLCSQEFSVKGKTTFKEEFVTCGGIQLNEIDPGTMQSKIIPGLFFAGEVLDVDGITGGFNFQNAWTTAWIAAKKIAELSNET